MAVVLAIVAASGPASAQQFVGGIVPEPLPVPNEPLVFIDAEDIVVRRSDSGGTFQPPDGPLLPDLLSLSVSPWAPNDPSVSLYAGQYSDNGGFMEIKLRFAGVINSSGPIQSPPNPMQYGPNPVLGFVEFDVDRNVDTGGETSLPELRFNATAGRFGGLPAGGPYIDRVSMDGADWNGDANAIPPIHRSGEEFHLALFGDFNDAVQPITEVSGDGDLIFDAGEIWQVKGTFLHRAHAYENLTFAGSYMPMVELRFRHTLVADVTTVTLVYPLTNDAFALSINGITEAEDTFDDNANSIREALGHLEASATLDWAAADPFWPMIDQWAGLVVDDYLDPRLWRSTALIGTTLSGGLNGGLIDYTDILPNVVLGDFNGDGWATNSDSQMVADYIALYDDDPTIDAVVTGTPDGEVVIIDFGVRFHVFDVDYNGIIDSNDVAVSQQMMGDFDTNGTVDLRDFSVFQRNFGLDGTLGTVGGVDPTDFRWVAIFDAFDFDDNDVIDWDDLGPFVTAMTGP